MGPCRTCAKPMRAKGVRDYEEPGTVQYGADGQCKTCRVHTRPKRETHTVCIDCGWDLRPKKLTSKERPGTRPHKGKGLCETCAGRGVKRVRKAVEPATTPPEDLVPLGDPDPGTVATLTAWEQRRQERIHRQERAHRIRVEQEAVQRRFIQSRRAA